MAKWDSQSQVVHTCMPSFRFVGPRVYLAKVPIFIPLSNTCTGKGVGR